MTLRQSIEDALYGRKSSVFLRALLFFVSQIYGIAVRLRLAAYEQRFLQTRKLPCPVISVGNITLGGTGKTPAVIAIAAFLQKRGKKPAILSRGYGRRDESSIVVVSDGAGTITDAHTSGDEPLLMATHLREVPVIVGRDRYSAGVTACSRFHPDVLVLDDGFQHLRLHRDLNIVLIDGLQPFGTGKLFPAGILREPIASLQRADVVLITRSDQSPDMTSLKELISKFTTAAIFTSQHVPTGLVDLADGSRKTLASLKGKEVLAFSGIAQPGSFISLLENLGANVRKTVIFPDHHRYTRDDIDHLQRQGLEVKAPLIVTTEKDGVKLRELDPRGFQALTIQLEILEKDAWERVLLQRL